MGMCVIPFLPGDAVKIVAASLLARPVRRALYRG
jgi:biotin transporter BioY